MPFRFVHYVAPVCRVYGAQETGKSFLLDIMEEIIGKDFFVVRKTRDMDSRFSAADLWGSKVFVDDDVKSDLTLPDDFIKLYSGEKSVTIEKKNKDAIKGVKISVAMFFISNHVFTLAGGSEGISRRVIYMPYHKKIKKIDTMLRHKICGRMAHGEESGPNAGKIFDERPALIALALRAMEKMIADNYEFTMPEWVRREREEWIRQSDTVHQFMEESVFENSVAWRFKKSELFERYKMWCSEEGKKAFGKTKFYSKVRQMGAQVKHESSGDYFEFPERLDEFDIPML